MSKSALLIGEPSGQWPGDAKLYVLSEPFNGVQRVVVTTVDLPDANDPDATPLSFTSVYSEHGVLLGGDVASTHEERLLVLGYERVIAGNSLINTITRMHLEDGGTIPGADGIEWEQEIAATRLVNDAVSDFLSMGYEDAAETITGLVVAAVRAAVAYGVDVEELLARKAAHV